MANKFLTVYVRLLSLRNYSRKYGGQIFLLTLKEAGGGGRGVQNDPLVREMSVISHMVTKILDFIHKDLNYKVLKSFFDYPWQVFQKFSRVRWKITIFLEQKLQNRLYFNFFITKVSYFVSNMNDDFYEAFFEVYYVSVSQKLVILEFSFWPRLLPIPPEAKVWASATSMRSQILAEYEVLCVEFGWKG